MSAFRLFLEKGYRDVSYTDLVAHTGMSKGAIYHHFSSKESLLHGVIEMLLSVAAQTNYDVLLVRVNSIDDFREMFVDLKKAQVNAILEIAGGKELKINKILFFAEAINESRQLLELVNKLSLAELEFMEKCFTRLCVNGSIEKRKSPQKLASTFFWMMQGIEIKFFFSGKNEFNNDLLDNYIECMNDFFDIL